MNNRYKDLALGGVITLSTILDEDNLTIDGVVFSAEDTAPDITAQEFATGASDTAAATNLAAAINDASAQALFDANLTRTIRRGDGPNGEMIDVVDVLSSVVAVANAATVELYRIFKAEAYEQTAIVLTALAGTVTYVSKNEVPSAAAQTFIAAGPRSYLRIQNLGADHVYVAFGRAANATNCLRLAAGEVLEMKEAVPHDYVSMIASATTRDVAIIVG